MNPILRNTLFVLIAFSFVVLFFKFYNFEITDKEFVDKVEKIVKSKKISDYVVYTKKDSGHYYFRLYKDFLFAHNIKIDKSYIDISTIITNEENVLMHNMDNHIVCFNLINFKNPDIRFSWGKHHNSELMCKSLIEKTKIK